MSYHTRIPINHRYTNEYTKHSCGLIMGELQFLCNLQVYLSFNAYCCFCSDPCYSETRLFQNYVTKQFIISLIISSAFFVSQLEIHLFFIVYDISRITREKKKEKQKQKQNKTKQKHSCIIIHTPNCNNIFIFDVIIG